MSVSCNPTVRLLDRVGPPPRRGRARVGAREPTPILAQRWLLSLCLLGCLCTIPASSSAQTPARENQAPTSASSTSRTPRLPQPCLEYAETYYSQLCLDLGLTTSCNVIRSPGSGTNAVRSTCIVTVRPTGRRLARSLVQWFCQLSAAHGLQPSGGVILPGADLAA
jgi:hypothetical protein